MPLGASIIDLLPAPAGMLESLPAGARSFLENLTAVDLSSSTTPGGTFHYGTLLPKLADLAAEDASRDWVIQGAGIDRGVRFQLAATRLATPTGSNIEPAPASFQLDLFFEQLSILLPMLKAARLVPAEGTTPPHLLPDPASSEVRLVGRAVLRFTNAGGSLSPPQLVDYPDPLVPAAPSGTVATMQFAPPHFFLGNSAIGLTVRKLTLDASATSTPPDIMARQQGPAWKGLAIQEALLYLPRETPFAGSLVLGVRDVLLGDPFGLQGEVRIEWGADTVTATPVQLSQAQGTTDADGYAPITQEWPPGELDRIVVFDPAKPLRFFAQVSSGPGTPASVRWILPDGSTANGLVTPEFRASAGDTLVCIRSEVPQGGGEPLDGPEIRHHFQAAPAQAPAITVALQGGTTHDNPVHVSGARDALTAAGLVFTAPQAGDGSALQWQLGDGAAAPVVQGPSFTFDASALPAEGPADLVLTDTAGTTRRVRIHTLEGAGLLVGAQAGVFDTAGAEQAVQAVERTVVLHGFHDDGSLLPTADPATTAQGEVQVPVDAMALVTVGAIAPPAALPGRHTRVRMVFDETNPSHDGEDIQAVEALMAAYPLGRFVLIGRCDDVGDATYNATLARERAAAMRERLIALGMAADRVIYRGEQDDPATGWVGDGAAPDPEALGVPADQQGDDWYAFEAEDALGTGHPLPNTPAEGAELIARRDEYRRVDIYAEGEPAADAAAPPPMGSLAAGLRRVWVPGADGEPPAAPIHSTPSLIHRVSVRVAWDSPTASTLADFVPTLAEVTVAYDADKLGARANLPTDLAGTGVGSGSGTTTPPGNDSEILTVTGRWTYDARSGETLFAASVDSTGDPLGLFHLDGNAIALAAAFGPAVVAAVQTDPDASDAAGVGVVGLVAASALLASAVKDGRVVCTGLAVEHKQRALDSLALSEQKMLFDYEASFNVDLSILNGQLVLKTSQPLKVRYRDVGIQLDWAKSDWWEVASFVFEGVSLEVVEPGQWEIGGTLGKFLGVQAVRMGTGSTWFEVDMAFNIDLGVVRLTSATIRIVADGGSIQVEIRGLGLTVSIPGVLEGSGSASIQADGSVAAGVDVDIVAAGLSARADVELKPTDAYVAIRVEVILPVGIPLANSGLGIFGFIGQFVSNGQRTMIPPLNEDPVQAELDWYEAEFGLKWGPKTGQWALGLGVIVGTLPDIAFTFNAQGMFVVTFPDPSVILGIDAKLLSAPATPSEGGRDLGDDVQMRLIGLTVIDPDAVMIGVRGTYSIPQVLSVNVPLSAYFPLAGSPAAARGSYVHLGADNITDADKVGDYPRAGDPVTMTLLPGLLDAQAWSYFMLEERQLHYLGNRKAFSFDGFSVGFGAGWNLTWKAGPLSLDASAQLLLGLGTSPLKLVGGIEAEGMLDATIASAGVSGELLLEVLDLGSDQFHKHLEGEFCIEVDLPLAPPIEKCLKIEIGSALVEPIPVPAHPLKGIDLTDRMGRRVAVAIDGVPGALNTAWPDTVPVLGFSHVPVLGGDFDADWLLAALPSNGSPWAGSSELKYAFRLDRVTIGPRPADAEGGSGPLDAVFWLPTHRGGVMSGTAADILPSEHEGAALALLSWVPFTALRGLTNGAEGLPADPVATLDKVCDTITIGHETCALGLDALPLEPGRITILSRLPAGDPVAASFTLIGTATLGGLSWRELPPALAALGLHPLAAGVVDLALPATMEGQTLRRGYELPGIGQPGPRYASLGWEGRFEPAVASGQVLLEVCDQGAGVRGGTLCFPFDDVNRASGTQWDTAGLRFVKTFTPAGTGVLAGVGGALQPGLGTLRMILPFPASWVRVTLKHDSNLLTVTAKGLRGAALATRVVPQSPDEQDLVLENLGPISELVFVSLDPHWWIRAVCVRAGLGQPDTALELPPLVGQRSTGELVFWASEILADETLADGVRCRHVLYTAPDDGGWQAIGIPAMQSATIRLVGACGLTTTLRQIRVADQAARDALRDGWNLKAGQLEQTRPLLEPNNVYTITVAMSWAGWRPASPGQQPPATVAEDEWQALPSVALIFRTAVLSVDGSSSLPTVPLTGEASFDPRSVARYLIGFEPAGPDAPPHLLNDALLVHFSVDHGEQLLAAYGYTLALELRRTDPPPGSVADGPLTPVALDIDRTALMSALMDPVDRRVIEAVRADPRCLSAEVNTGGVTLAATGELEPDAEYDLLLKALPEGGGSSLLVARSHFHSSRHADVKALLASLGFADPGPSLFVPTDFVVANGASMPPADPLASDAVLEDALRTLGMDPWPLAPQGRTVAIWLPGSTAGGWQLAGLLLENPEPLQRADRCNVAQALVLRGGSTLATYVPLRANTAGTRVLLAIAGDADGRKFAGDGLVLQMQMNDRLTLRSASRVLRALPRVAYQELP